MKALLAAALLLGLSSLTAARAEWEILDPGTDMAPVVAGAGTATANPTGKACTTEHPVVTTK